MCDLLLSMLGSYLIVTPTQFILAGRRPKVVQAARMVVRVGLIFQGVCHWLMAKETRALFLKTILVVEYCGARISICEGVNCRHSNLPATSTSLLSQASEPWLWIYGPRPQILKTCLCYNCDALL